MLIMENNQLQCGNKKYFWKRIIFHLPSSTSLFFLLILSAVEKQDTFFILSNSFSLPYRANIHATRMHCTTPSIRLSIYMWQSHRRRRINQTLRSIWHNFKALSLINHHHRAKEIIITFSVLASLFSLSINYHIHLKWTESILQFSKDKNNIIS